MRHRTAQSDDTIVAIITPPGEGGIAALRLAGPRSLEFTAKHFRTAKNQPIELDPFHLRYGFFHSSSGQIIDEVTAVAMPSGQSYTGLQQVEIFCHGGRMVVRLLLDELIRTGARPAEPGEFTKLAFLSGRIDLARAEAVAEMIAANTLSSFQASREHLLGAYSEHVATLREQTLTVVSDLEALIDFPEEEITPTSHEQITSRLHAIIEQLQALLKTYLGGRIIAEGFSVVIGGRPNAGKSSLFNLLLRKERALVNPRPGTTRDYLSEWIDLEGFAVNLIDTAGIRRRGDPVEKQGIERAKTIISGCDLLLWVVDPTRRSWKNDLRRDLADMQHGRTQVLINKVDIAPKNSLTWTPDVPFMRLSAKTGAGLTELTRQIVAEIEKRVPDLTSGVVVTSARHKHKLSAAIKALRIARSKNASGESPEVVAFEVRQACNALDEITGKVYSEEILGRIFGKFCIGK